MRIRMNLIIAKIRKKKQDGGIRPPRVADSEILIFAL